MNFRRFSEGLRLGMSAQVADEMTRVYSGGDKKQKSSSTSTPAQSAQYNNLLGKADSWLNGGGLDKNYGGSADFDPVANLTDAQTGAIAGQTQVGGALQDLYNSQGMSSIGNFLGAYDPNKTGLNSAIDAANNSLDWNYNTSVAPSIRQGAVQSGQYGSSRSGVAEGIAQSQLSQQKMNNAATMAYQDQQSYNNNQLNALNSLSSITSGLNSGNTAQYNAGALEQSQQQSEIQGQLEKWAYENNVDLSNLQAYKSLISGDMGGTTNSTSTTPGQSAWGAIGKLAGTAAGAYFGGPMGAQIGAQVGGAAGG